MSNEYETLRWPTNLDRAGIEKRLVEVRETAQRAGLEALAAGLSLAWFNRIL